MPEVQAHLADGTILQFPEGTDPSVVQATVKRHLSAQAGVPDKPPAGSVSAGNGAPDYGGLPGGGTLVDAARPFSIPAAMSVGSDVAGMTPGPPQLKALVGAGAGAATYLGADTALQRIRNLLQGSSESPDLMDSAKNLAINEIGGRALGVIARGANAGLGRVSKAISSLFPGINAALTPAQEELSKLSPTFAQYFGNKPIPKTLEDLFASGTKNAAIKNSGRLADEAITNEAASVSKRSPNVMNPYDIAARVRQNDLTNTLNDTFKEADVQAKNAKVIAQGNPGTYLNESTGQVTPIAGPIQLNTTLEKANKIYSDGISSIVPPSGEETPAINKAYQMIKSTQAQFDQSGKLIKRQPVPFDEAWDLKKELDGLSGFGKNRGDLTTSERQFRDLASSLNDDIESSLPKWKNGGKQATQAWLNSKDAVAQRQALLYAEGSNNKLGDIISNIDSPIPAINSILGDRDQLQRALNSGSIKFRSGNVSSSNMRGDLQAANFINLREAGKVLDPGDAEGGLTLNGQKMYNAWKDLKSPRNTVLYSAQQRQDYDQLYKNIAATQTKQSAIGSYLSKLYLVKGGLAIAPSLVGMSTGSSAIKEIAAVELGAMGIAHLMAKPDTARILVAAAGGQPLSMSEQMAARKLTAGLQGVTIALTGKDGSKQEGSFDREGNFQPTESDSSSPPRQ